MKSLKRWQLYERSPDSGQMERPRILMMVNNRGDFIDTSYFGVQCLIENDLGERWNH